MTLKLASKSALIIALFFLTAACVFAVTTAYTPLLSGAPLEPDEQPPALARGISEVPHPVDVERFVNCENCHAIGARRAMPDNHRTFSNESCSLCHLYPPPSEQVEPSEQAQEAAVQEAAVPAPHTFGWSSPIDEQAVSAFDLPDPCAVGSNLEQILMQEECSVRSDGITCVACHNAGLPLAGVRLDDLTGKQDTIDRGYVDMFVREESAKPANLKRLFADWQARGYPD